MRIKKKTKLTKKCEKCQKNDPQKQAQSWVSGPNRRRQSTRADFFMQNEFGNAFLARLSKKRKNRQKRSQKDPRTIPNRSQNDPKTTPKRTPTRPQTDPDVIIT